MSKNTILMATVLSLLLVSAAPALAQTATGVMWVKNNRVGIGVSDPESLLHLKTTSGEPNIRLQTTDVAGVRFELLNSGGEWEFIHGPGGGFNFNRVGVAGNQFVFQPSGNLVMQGTLFTGGSCSVGCDRVFDVDYELETIEEHAASMWSNRHLPGVGPTPDEGLVNISKTTGGLLNELEKAHIYIEQLHMRLLEVETRLAEVEGK